jgi:TetR/AcrR family transcriptional regulator, transcriptional repressor for nem operon
MPQPNLREAIVEAALDQFHRVGFNGCSVENITNAADVPKGSFYNHFKSKEALALEVIERYRKVGEHKSLVEQQRSPVQRLKEYFAYLAKNFTDEDYARGCLLGNFANEMADHSPAIQKQLKRAFADWTAALASLIKEAQAAGEVSRAANPEQLAAFLLSAWEGTLVRARCTKDASPLTEFNKTVFSVVLRP